ncbi:beta-propeller fold lactonase family protein [Leptospira levettii]|uniref:beta-propeller fold lactonase family protein n=1 Tax=Leptospira levettii TaxID=2023178 RepID=UPI00223DE5B9|nr:beta-propeller fold lactonase family protein [Leptospira levettii]MCW7507715.1 beta-propeller fold lactonase family protein [Leptospira levettii]MCW7518805.1 beta-propeller fold lactonase family protein [Leptospira levettii]
MKFILLFLTMLSLNACLLNPIVQQVLCTEKNNDSRDSLLFWLFLANQNYYVELNRNWAGIKKGQTLQLSAQYFVFGQNTSTSFQWSSSDVSVATVDQTGLVQGISNGKVSIIASTLDGRASAVSAVSVYSGYVYTTLNFIDSVGHLTMDEVSGVLTSNGTASVLPGSDPNGIVTDPGGKYLFTGDFGSGNISHFLINQSTGALTANGNTIAGANPRNLVVTPNGKYVYLASEGTQSIRAFSINGDGTLTFINSFSTSIGHSQIQISRNGNFIFYLSQNLTEVVSYRINYNDGNLTLVGTSPTFANDGSGSIATHPNGIYLYVGSYPSITILRFDSISGNLSFVDSVLHSKTINGSAIHPNGRFYYTVDINNFSISGYSVDPNNGRISLFQTLTGFVGSSLRFIIIEPAGRYAYVADNSGNIKHLNINESTGELTLVGTVNPGSAQWNLTFL